MYSLLKTIQLVCGSTGNNWCSSAFREERQNKVLRYLQLRYSQKRVRKYFRSQKLRVQKQNVGMCVAGKCIICWKTWKFVGCRRQLRDRNCSISDTFATSRNKRASFRESVRLTYIFSPFLLLLPGPRQLLGVGLVHFFIFFLMSCVCPCVRARVCVCVCVCD